MDSMASIAEIFLHGGANGVVLLGIFRAFFKVFAYGCKLMI